jgi:hypothetical protein
MSGQSDFLFAEPSAVEGAARIFDFGNSLTEYNYSLTPEQADRIAIAMDWRAVGHDLWRAIAKFRDDGVPKEPVAAGTTK